MISDVLKLFIWGFIIFRNSNNSEIYYMKEKNEKLFLQ